MLGGVRRSLRQSRSRVIGNIEKRLGYALLPLEPESMMRAARAFEPSALIPTPLILVDRFGRHKIDYIWHLRL
jgi:hypothetical protein